MEPGLFWRRLIKTRFNKALRDFFPNETDAKKFRPNLHSEHSAATPAKTSIIALHTILMHSYVLIEQ
jgi:hypothetical protein